MSKEEDFRGHTLNYEGMEEKLNLIEKSIADLMKSVSSQDAKEIEKHLDETVKQRNGEEAGCRLDALSQGLTVLLDGNCTLQDYVNISTEEVYAEDAVIALFISLSVNIDFLEAYDKICDKYTICDDCADTHKFIDSLPTTEAKHNE